MPYMIWDAKDRSPKPLHTLPIIMLKHLFSPPTIVGLNYHPSHLTQIINVSPNGTGDLKVLVYWPGLSSTSRSLQVKVGRNPWLALEAGEMSHYWQALIHRVAAGTAVLFRVQDAQGKWHPFTPLTALERVYATSYVPDLRYSCRQNPPIYDRARILLETTLEGLLSGYAGGRLAPRSRQELFQNPIARTILKTDIPHILSEWAIDQVMAPITSSVADRSYLNPKFNYLTYDVADVDWQIGTHKDFVQLVDRFYEAGITIVPDLIFVHQVSQCFEGSLDTLTTNNAKPQIAKPDNTKPQINSGQSIFVDENAYRFRDYGTWMFKLEDPVIRQQLIDKIVSLVDQYHLKMIRLDYIDGLILQYAHRKINFGEIFLQELRKALKSYDPQLLILGETFAVLDNSTVKGAIDIFYTPVGFPIIEELYKPAEHRSRPLYPSLDRLVSELNYFTTLSRSNAVYAQLHDETCADEHIAASRPHVPWAYGNNPAELARQQGQSLVDRGLLPQRNLLDYTRRLVRNTEALTLFSANLLYMCSPAVDALTLGSSDQFGNWRVHWDGATIDQLKIWKGTGLTELETIALHQQHRSDMIRLRQIFRYYTLVNPQSAQPLTQVTVYHVDNENAVVGLLRRSLVSHAPSLIILFNLGARSFTSPSGYEFPLPPDCFGTWQILFHGDDSIQASPVESSGRKLSGERGTFLPEKTILRLNFEAWTLIVLAQEL